MTSIANRRPRATSGNRSSAARGKVAESSETLRRPFAIETSETPGELSVNKSRKYPSNIARQSSRRRRCRPYPTPGASRLAGHREASRRERSPVPPARSRIPIPISQGKPDPVCRSRPATGSGRIYRSDAEPGSIDQRRGEAKHRKSNRFRAHHRQLGRLQATACYLAFNIRNLFLETVHVSPLLPAIKASPRRIERASDPVPQDRTGCRCQSGRSNGSVLWRKWKWNCRRFAEVRPAQHRGW